MDKNQVFLELTVEFQRKTYSTEDFIKVYEKIHQKYDLPKNEAQKVAQDLEEHNGIFVQTGYERYEYSHKSIQEYLAAEYIVKMPNIPTNLIYNINIANELAIAVTLSSDTNHYFYNLVFKAFIGKNLKANFVIEFEIL